RRHRERERGRDRGAVAAGAPARRRRLRRRRHRDHEARDGDLAPRRHVARPPGVPPLCRERHRALHRPAGAAPADGRVEQQRCERARRRGARDQQPRLARSHDDLPHPAAHRRAGARHQGKGAAEAGGRVRRHLRRRPLTITARATDAGGRSGEARIAIVVASPPILTIIAPADGTAFVPGAAVTFSAAASEVDVGDLSGSITWTSSLDGLLGTGGTISTSTLRSGTHTITASVTDGRGKVAAAMRTVVVNAAPTIAITGPADGAGFVPGETIRFTGAAQDREDGNLSAIIAWRSSLDGPLGSGGALDVSTLRSGTHTITAAVADSGGKTAEA